MHFTLIKNFINKTLKFGWYIPFSNLILNYGNKVLPPIVLDKLFSKRNRKIQLKTAPILKKSIIRTLRIGQPNNTTTKHPIQSGYVGFKEKNICLK